MLRYVCVEKQWEKQVSHYLSFITLNKCSEPWRPAVFTIHAQPITMMFQSTVVFICVSYHSLIQLCNYTAIQAMLNHTAQQLHVAKFMNWIDVCILHLHVSSKGYLLAHGHFLELIYNFLSIIQRRKQKHHTNPMGNNWLGRRASPAPCEWRCPLYAHC